MVVGCVVIVAIAVPGTVTAVGLSVQVGGSVVAIAAVTWQVKATVPVNPEFSAGASWIVVEDTPPGATADGDNAEGCSVNSDVPCPTATAASTKTTANKHTVTRAVCTKIILILDSVRLAFNMNGYVSTSFDSKGIKKAARTTIRQSTADVVPVGSLTLVTVGSGSNFTVIRHRIISRRFWRCMVQTCDAGAPARERCQRKKLSS